jgi:uncharacterized membrane protein YphA (DoxX/SURF4 family)/peroxiredoxin
VAIRRDVAGSSGNSGRLRLGTLAPMALLVLVLRVALALVFAAAAAGKLLDLAGSRRAVRDFGLPGRTAAVVGTLLPFGELAIAVAMILTRTGRWAGLAALALLLAFVVAIGRLMAAGQAPDCHCFGQLHSEPAGQRTLVRNGLLAVAAAIVLGAGPGRGLGALSGEDVALVAVSVTMLALAAASASLLLENRDLRHRPAGRRRPPAEPGLPVGTPAPDLTLSRLDASPVALRDLIGHGTPAVLIHISPQCGPCRTLAPNLAGWRTSLTGELDLVTVSSGEFAENTAFAADLGLDDLLVAAPSAFADAYHARATPTAVMIDPAGRVAARSVAGPMAIESLIRVALHKTNGTATLNPLQIVQIPQTT